MEEQHGDRVAEEILLALCVNTAHPVQRDLDWLQNRRQESTLAGKHARHVGAKHRRDSHDDGAVEQDLNPADGGHGPPFQNRSGLSNA